MNQKPATLSSEPNADPTADIAPPVGYLHEVDVVRLLTFASVIGVHSVAQAATGNNVAANSIEVILHFTRDAFFSLTGFVLFHTNYRRSLNLREFWAKRFPVVLVPYVVWSSIYFCFWVNNHNGLPLGRYVQRYGYDLLTGSAEYHLYFLLVSMQIYALFPALRWLVQKTTGYHGFLFAGLFVINGLFVAWLHFPVHSGNVRIFVDNMQEVIITYFVFIFGGAIAAVHMHRFRHWVGSHVVLIVVGAFVGLALAETTYGIEIHHNQSASYAADPLQPTIMFWSLGIVLILYIVGLQWARQRQPGRLAAFISEASRASFGVYLVHPLILIGIANLGFSWDSSLASTPVDAIVAWTGAVVGSAIFVEFFLRTPLAMPLTGRYRTLPANAKRS